MGAFEVEPLISLTAIAKAIVLLGQLEIPHLVELSQQEPLSHASLSKHFDADLEAFHCFLVSNEGCPSPMSVNLEHKYSLVDWLEVLHWQVLDWFRLLLEGLGPTLINQPLKILTP